MSRNPNLEHTHTQDGKLIKSALTGKVDYYQWRATEEYVLHTLLLLQGKGLLYQTSPSVFHTLLIGQFTSTYKVSLNLNEFLPLPWNNHGLFQKVTGVEANPPPKAVR